MDGENGYKKISGVIERVLDGQAADGPRVVNFIFFGEEDPDQLVIYLAFEDSKTLKAAEKSGDAGRIAGDLSAALKDEGYSARPIEILFISEQEVEESGGPFKYFK